VAFARRGDGGRHQPIGFVPAATFDEIPSDERDGNSWGWSTPRSAHRASLASARCRKPNRRRDHDEAGAGLVSSLGRDE
jgi:hypothetical protein